MRAVPLTAIKGGMSRLRIKGGARADTLYDLLNAYVTDAETVHVRPGTRRIFELDDSTRGICSFDGTLHTFGSEVVDVPTGITLHVLVHPSSTPDTIIGLSKIHFATPYLGFLYVVAEFEDEAVYHFWLRVSGTWEADKIYFNGDIVEPTVVNGLAYQATRLGSPNPSWAPNVPRTNGDIVEPTVYNDFFYTVVDTIGAAPRSGTVEPDWPESDGAQVVEDVDGLLSTSATPTTPPNPSSTTPTEVQERYG